MLSDVFKGVGVTQFIGDVRIHMNIAVTLRRRSYKEERFTNEMRDDG